MFILHMFVLSISLLHTELSCILGKWMNEGFYKYNGHNKSVNFISLHQVVNRFPAHVLMCHGKDIQYLSRGVMTFRVTYIFIICVLMGLLSGGGRRGGEAGA